MKRTMLMALALGLSLPTTAGERVMDMYKSEHCGYCSLQGKTVEKNGFKVRAHVMNDQALSTLKEEYSVPARLCSCHTATAGELVIEGRIPMTMVHRAMQSSSSTYGLATLGMPIGSPGIRIGDQKETYDVIIFAPDGSQNTFQRIEQTLIAGRRYHSV